jgi:hypothetical protein
LRTSRTVFGVNADGESRRTVVGGEGIAGSLAMASGELDSTLVGITPVML